MKSKPKPKNRTLKIDYWLSIYFAPDSSLTFEKLCIEIYRKVSEVKLILSQDEPVDVLKEKIKMLKQSSVAYCLQYSKRNREKYRQYGVEFRQKNNEYNANYYNRNRESHNQKSREYHKNNKEYCNQKSREYSKHRKNRDKIKTLEKLKLKNYTRLSILTLKRIGNLDDVANSLDISTTQLRLDLPSRIFDILMKNESIQKVKLKDKYTVKITELITDKGLTVNEIAKNLNMDKANLYCKIKKVPELYQKLVKPVNQIAKSEFDAIRELKKQGQTYQTIADKYNCTIRTIEKIVKGLTKS